MRAKSGQVDYLGTTVDVDLMHFLRGIAALSDSRVQLTDSDDTFAGSDSRDVIFCQGGNDRVAGGKGTDVIRGEIGSDELNGDRGRDKLFGGDGNDELTGSKGPDILVGGLGSDIIDAGSGHIDGQKDVIAYETVNDSVPDEEDLLYFFQLGEDKIDLSAIDADAGTAEDDAFDFIGGRAFGGTAGELRFAANPGSTQGFLEADVDGDGQADLRIEYRGLLHDADPTFHARDFVL